MLRTCYLSGQMTEAQWQEHVANGDVEALAGAADDSASISPLEAAMILGREAMQLRARQFMDKHPELPPELRRLAWLGLDTPEGQEYWAAMELMGRYAHANHEIIHRKIERALGELDDDERRAEMSADCRAWAARFSWGRMHAEAVALVAASINENRSRNDER